MTSDFVADSVPVSGVIPYRYEALASKFLLKKIILLKKSLGKPHQRDRKQKP
jgi:hypothetical protein